MQQSKQDGIGLTPRFEDLRNTQFDSRLLTIQERVVVDGQTAIQIVVAASETVTLTFFVEGFLKG